MIRKRASVVHYMYIFCLVNFYNNRALYTYIVTRFAVVISPERATDSSGDTATSAI
jgi:hypothetical protein